MPGRSLTNFMTQETKQKDRSHAEGQKWKCSVLLNTGSQKRMGQKVSKILRGKLFQSELTAILTLNAVGGLMKDTFRHSGPQIVTYFSKGNYGGCRERK